MQSEERSSAAKREWGELWIPRGSFEWIVVVNVLALAVMLTSISRQKSRRLKSIS